MKLPSRKATEEYSKTIRGRARALLTEKDVDPTLDRLASGRIAVLSGASFGTEDCYGWWRHLSERLLTEAGFSILAFAGDSDDFQHLDQYVRHGTGNNPLHVLQDFEAFPTWSWANTEIIRLTEWLRQANLQRPKEAQVSCIGLDVYGASKTFSVALQLLAPIDPFSTRRLENRLSLVDWGHLEPVKIPKQVVDETIERRLADLRVLSDTDLGQQLHLRDLAAEAPRYYQILLGAGREAQDSWFRHLDETMAVLLKTRGDAAKAVMWLPNIYIKTAALLKKRLGRKSCTAAGFAIFAGEQLGSPFFLGTPRAVPFAPPSNTSVEAMLHELALRKRFSQFAVVFNENDRKGILSLAVPHRSFGPILKPEAEGHVTETSLPAVYDVLLFVDSSSPLTPVGVEAPAAAIR